MMSEWISVKDELPECYAHSGGDNYYSELVIVRTSKGEYFLARCMNDKFGKISITHWACLPDTPEDGWNDE